MAVTQIDNFLDGIQEPWMRQTFVDRLDNARLIVDDSSFGNVEGANQSLSLFMALSSEERTREISRLRILNQVDQWASDMNVSTSDINSIITSLRAIRDAKIEAAQTSEPEDTPENTEPIEGE